MPKIRMFGGPKDGKPYLVSSGKDSITVDGKDVPIYGKREKGRIVMIANWSEAEDAK